MADGALHEEPTTLRGVDRNGLIRVLGEALEGVDLGRYDLGILDWLAGWEPSTVATIVSLIGRARAAELDAAVKRIADEANREERAWQAAPEDDRSSFLVHQARIDGLDAAAEQVRRAQ